MDALRLASFAGLLTAGFPEVVGVDAQAKLPSGRWGWEWVRARFRSREIPKDGYSDRVVALRKKYFLLSIRLELWTDPLRSPMQS